MLSLPSSVDTKPSVKCCKKLQIVTFFAFKAAHTIYMCHCVLLYSPDIRLVFPVFPCFCFSKNCISLFLEKSISHVVLLLPRYQIHLTCVQGSGAACAAVQTITGKLVLLLILNNLYSCKPDFCQFSYQLI